MAVGYERLSVRDLRRTIIEKKLGWVFWKEYKKHLRYASRSEMAEFLNKQVE